MTRWPDCINDYDRISAHCANIALAVLQLQDEEVRHHVYSRMVDQGERPDVRKWIQFYREKYLSYINTDE